jgi:hypothetical protein
MAPKPEETFKDGKISVLVHDSKETYAFRINDIKYDEYDTYVRASKDAGFSNIHYEGENDGGKMFMAYTEDEDYYLEAFLGYEIDAVDVSCKLCEEE